MRMSAPIQRAAAGWSARSADEDPIAFAPAEAFGLRAALRSGGLARAGLTRA
jgi:hypothetical protein